MRLVFLLGDFTGPDGAGVDPPPPLFPRRFAPTMPIEGVSPPPEVVGVPEEPDEAPAIV